MSTSKFALVAILLNVAIAVWAVDAQVYTSPDDFPEAFEMTFIRHDYRVNDDTGENEEVNRARVTVKWEPNYTWTNSGVSHYGRMTINNFYSTPYAATPTCNLEFINRYNRNFQWNDDGTVCTLSFTAYTWSAINTSYRWSANKYNSSQYVFLANNSYSNNSTVFWYSGESCDYQYQGGAVTLTFDLTANTITIDQHWGIYTCMDRYGKAPSYCIEYFNKTVFTEYVTNLSDIISDAEEGETVTVNDELLGVAVVPQYDDAGNKVRDVLLAKDFGRYANPSVNTAGKIDYMARYIHIDSYDQSNWVALTFDDVTSDPSFDINAYKAKRIAARSITGTVTDLTNPEIAVTSIPMTVATEAYLPNVYVISGFDDGYQANDSKYFFVAPKPMEYCYVKWAVYDIATDAFYVSVKEGTNNPLDMDGAVSWSSKYLGNDTPGDHEAYNFLAIATVKTSVSPAPARAATSTPKTSSTISTRYTLMPLDLGTVVTGIDDIMVSDNNAPVRYYDLMGRESATPHRGINIVVTAGTATKQVY